MSSSGTLKSFNQSRGFGFITSGGQDFFFHKSDVSGRPPKEGDTLNFDSAPSQKDPSKVEAKNVTGGTAGGSNRGTVKWFNESKGYGFIDEESGASHFMHVNDVSGGTPMEGDVVWFDIAPSEKDPSKTMAKDVVGGSGYAAGKGWGGGGGGKGYGKDMLSMMWMMQQMYGWGGKGYGGGKGGGAKGACHQFQQGNCSYGENCRFQH